MIVANDLTAYYFSVWMEWKLKIETLARKATNLPVNAVSRGMADQ